MKKLTVIFMSLLFAGVLQVAEAAYRPVKAKVAAVAAHRRIGMRIHKRPHRCVLIRFRNIPYYYAAGVFYRKIEKEYEVIRPEIGMVVPELPESGVRTVVTKEGTRFIYDEVIYKEVPTKKGVKYEVVGFVRHT